MNRIFNYLIILIFLICIITCLYLVNKTDIKPEELDIKHNDNIILNHFYFHQL